MRAADRGLFRDSYERDSCGFGLIAQLDDQPSHWLVKTAMSSLNRLTHRGAVASDGKTGDGCGLLLKQPEEFLRALAQETAIDLAHLFASGLVFLNPDSARAAQARRTLLAVSYTHLDVYKRQLMCRARSTRETICPTRPKPAMMTRLSCSSTVSYTHLDVYKRQR